MGVCRYCGQKAGWFTDVHDTCVHSAQEGCAKVASLIAESLKKPIPTDHDDEEWYKAFAQQLWRQVEPEVAGLQKEHRTTSDQLHEAMRQGWSIGVEQSATAEPMAGVKLAFSNNFYRAMGLTDQEMRSTNGFVAQIFSTLLWSVLVAGDPTLVANVPRHPFNLKAGEIPLFFFGSVVYSKEVLSRGNLGAYSGMSMRVARGVYYHFGGFKSQRMETPTLKEIDYGGMLLTTQNMYFGGEHTNFRIPYNHVVAFHPETSGISFFRDTANAKAEVFTVLEANPRGGNPVNARPIFGWFLFNMTHALAQPEAIARYTH